MGVGTMGKKPKKFGDVPISRMTARESILYFEMAPTSEWRNTLGNMPFNYTKRSEQVFKRRSWVQLLKFLCGFVRSGRYSIHACVWYAFIATCTYIDWHISVCIWSSSRIIIVLVGICLFSLSICPSSSGLLPWKFTQEVSLSDAHTICHSQS